jgi:hypothetical protein
VPPAPLVEFPVSYKTSKTDYYSSEDNDYRKNNSLAIYLRHKEEANNDSAKSFAKLLVVDDDSDIVKVLQLGIPIGRSGGANY